MAGETSGDSGRGADEDARQPGGDGWGEGGGGGETLIDK